LGEPLKEEKRIFCNVCGGETSHRLRAGYSRTRKICLDEDGAPLDDPDVFHVRNSAEYSLFDAGEIRTSIWSCAGCEQETFEWHYIPTGDELGGNREYYPERTPERPNDLLQPKPFLNMNERLTRIYREIIGCFNADYMVLCSIGLGALLEGICKEKGLSGRTKVNDLIKFVPNLNVIQALIDFVDARNNAAHQLDAPSREKARLAIEVMEDLLSFLYNLDYKALLVKAGARKDLLESAKPPRVQ
jgi:hypothetical protein